MHRRSAACATHTRLPPLPLPQFSALGVGCAGAAVALYEGVRVSEIFLRPLPRWVSAPLGGALCGLIAFWHPQVGCCRRRPLRAALPLAAV
jgi:H+/Cl- antiporter ClcA